EDGIRDRTVTGVQTCALPILPVSAPKNRQTPVPAFNATASRENSFLVSAIDEPTERIRPPMEMGGVGSDLAEKRKIKSLEEKTSMGKAPFWPVDPVEWSPIADAVT